MLLIAFGAGAIIGATVSLFVVSAAVLGARRQAPTPEEERLQELRRWVG